MALVEPGQHAAKALAALDQPVGLQPRLEALEQGEVVQPGQGPVDAGGGDLEQILAGDRVCVIEHFRHGARQPGAFLDGDVVIDDPLGHDLQPPALRSAHQAQAYDREAQAFGHGVHELEQLTILGSSG